MFTTTSRRLAAGLVLVLAFAVQIVSLHGAADPSPSTDVLVKGTGLSITRPELEAEIVRVETEITNRGEGIIEEARDQMRAEILDRMVFRRLVSAQATDADRRRALFEANAFITGAKSREASPEAYARRLKRAGFTEESFKADKHAEILTATVLDREVRSGIQLNDGVIRAAYEAEPGRWTKPGTVRGLDLMLSSKDPATALELEGTAREQKLKELRSLRARAVKGEDFTVLVRRHTEDPRGRELGGIFTLAQTGAAPELEAALVSLKAGDVSEVLTTPSGFHLVKVLEVSPGETIPYTNAAPKLRFEMMEMEFQRRLTTYVARLKREAALSYAPGAPRLPDRKP